MPRRSAASSEFNIRGIESLGRLLVPPLASSRTLVVTTGPGHFASNILHPGRRIECRRCSRQRARFHFARAPRTSGSNIKKKRRRGGILRAIPARKKFRNRDRDEMKERQELRKSLSRPSAFETVAALICFLQKVKCYLVSFAISTFVFLQITLHFHNYHSCNATYI